MYKDNVFSVNLGKILHGQRAEVDQGPSCVSGAQCWCEARIRALKSPCSLAAAVSPKEQDMFR